MTGLYIIAAYCAGFTIAKVSQGNHWKSRRFVIFDSNRGWVLKWEDKP